MGGIRSLIRAVTREKAKATGITWRRLHRVESLLNLAEGVVRAVPVPGRRKRAPKKAVEQQQQK